jgi:hypothetical protein
MSTLGKSFKQLKTREAFIERANERHNNKYEYSKVKFDKRGPLVSYNGKRTRKAPEYNRDQKITITCPVHGDFIQTARKHIEKDPSGCQKCAAEQTGKILKQKWKNGELQAYQRRGQPKPKDGMLICMRCEKELPLTNEYFSRDKQKTIGFRPECKKCKNEKMRSEEEREKQRIKDQRRAKNLPAGIYRATNLKTGRVYIGKSIRLPDRIKHHKTCLTMNKHKNPRMQADYNLYGKEYMIYEVIEEHPCDTPSETLREREREQIIDHIKKGYKLYNKIN